MTVELHLGDCLEILPTLPNESVDAVITDPPYPCIKRDYGYWTEQEWWDLMMPVVEQTRRILKPTGSAVFILQPNSKHIGQMRGWLWEFMAWICREWNMVQDAWWWNPATLPSVHTHQKNGLMRTSMKACVWIGNFNCYRKQDAVLITVADSVKMDKRIDRLILEKYPSGWNNRRGRLLKKCQKRGGATPYNLIISGNGLSTNGHGAGTPLALADWWTRYICPPGGIVADWFMGSGTMGIAAVQNGCSFIGIEKINEPGYFPTAQERITKAQAAAQLQPQLEGLT